jgi:hypothetical protein
MGLDYNKDILYCDNCGEPMLDKQALWIEELPIDVDSANAGESAVLCKACFIELDMQDALNNMLADISPNIDI